ncbi:MAG: DNA polymerase/3'-5' exonuclease PolX [Acidobacteriia bacterium]|nr:DNA polymerase/3'-5' exonuclease PolX [Terriglobia bacterium]
MVDNKSIAEVFHEIADLLEIKGDNPFRIRSYRNAAMVVETYPESFDTLVREGTTDLQSISGIGEAISGKIKEIVASGDCKAHRDLLKQVPGSLLEIMQLQGVGPKTTALLWKKMHVKTVEDVEKLATAGKLRKLPGLGEKSEQKILESIQNRKKFSGRHLLSQAEEAAEEILRYLGAKPGEKATRKSSRRTAGVNFFAVPAGSLRRARETIGDVDILVTGKKCSAVIDRFVKFPGVDSVLAHGDTKGSVRLKTGLQIDLRAVEEKSLGAALQYFTGSKDHNVALRTRAQKMGFTINEYGLFAVDRKGEKEKWVAGRTEEEIYEKLKLQFIPPELRENRGEIEAAEKKSLPRLVELEDVRGDLHMHTTETDGTASLGEMVEAARGRGLQYIAITDHTQSTRVANGMDEKRLEKQIQAIDKLQRQFNDITVFKGTECDILADGRLDLPDSILEQLDVVVVSIHSHFQQSTREVMDRLERAFSNPHVRIFAHPTGRLLFHRPAYAVDLEKLFALAKKYKVCLELNSQPERLDLNDVALRRAPELGVPIVISTDSHATQQLDYLKFGVRTARRGWLEAKHIANTQPMKTFLKTISRH